MALGSVFGAPLITHVLGLSVALLVSEYTSIWGSRITHTQYWKCFVKRHFQSENFARVRWKITGFFFVCCSPRLLLMEHTAWILG